MFTYNELQELVPKKQRNVVTEDLVILINEIADDETIGVEFTRNMIDYSTVLAQGKYSLEEYMSANHFVTLLLLQHKDIDAYKIVFPDRYMRLLAKGLTRSQMGSYATNYKQNKLVTQILEQTMVPSNVLNAPMYQEALNHSRYLMLNAKSETVQQNCAEAIMTQLKGPESSKLEIDISINQSDSVRDNEAFMIELAEKKLELMRLGGNIKDITNMTVDKIDVIDVEEM